ncbi:kinetochore-associated protein NSL1 homolog [Acanthaster planci]|uniref:Kinetochore-associated protein NSL1 homolog n=1 Tax=Acanthaster planci TaxID=133434 RepID=A0A8B7YN40_ACAPL|nr:kinetochore-associated protein NSL1 homolog [Acanthaster planci]
MATEGSDCGTEALSTETRISCCSKQSLDAAVEKVLCSIDRVIGKNSEWPEEQKERLRRRFREVYKSSLHENCCVDGQSWAEAIDADTTKEFEPVDLKKKADAEQTAADLDALIVATVAKRKEFPPRLTQQLAKKLQCQHTATEQYKPVLPKPIEDPSPIISAEDEQDVSSRVTASSDQVSVLSRLLPDLEDKSGRIYESINIHASLAANKTQRVITKPSENESKMATSLTPLRAQAQDNETSTAHPQAATASALKRQRLMAQVHNNKMKRYKARPANMGKPT